MELRTTIIVLLIMIMALIKSTSALSHKCIDHSGDEVDWFVLYKLPKEKNSSDPHVRNGLAFVQFTSKAPQLGWRVSDVSIADPRSPPGRTLFPLYQPEYNKNLLTIFYNDEHPDGHTSFTDGHTKGVVAFNQDAGFWLVHSVPKYPPHPAGGKYGYPHTGQLYGQSFLCISLDSRTSADDIGIQLMFNHPYIYYANVPTLMDKLFPNLALAARGKHFNKKPMFNVLTFPSFNKSIEFTSFAKETHFGMDLYADLVAPTLASSLLVETWPNGRGRMKSRCDVEYPVENIESLKFYNHVVFTTEHDHAKWAVSLKDERPILCIGDINRMDSQRHRAGGTVCFEHKYAWKSFHSSISAIESCPRAIVN